jgi:flagellar motor switch protein FliG
MAAEAPVSRASARISALAALLVACALAPIAAELSWDSERLNLEIRMQQRVEEAISKIVPPSQFLVVVRVEPWQRPIDGGNQRTAPAPANDDGFYLPGVPSRKRLDSNASELSQALGQLKPEDSLFKRFIKRVNATLVLDKDLPNETVDRVRDLTRQMLGLDAARGDVLDVQRTAFQKQAVTAPAEGIAKIQDGLKSYWIVIALALVLFCIFVFLLFVFGPLRGFLNRFVQVLPTLAPADAGRMRGLPDQAMSALPALTAMMAQNYGLLPQANGGASPASFSGSLQVENPNKTTLPFGFIREDHLHNLAILLARETAEKAAVVLGYMSPSWISRILARFDPAFQSEVTHHLATTRQLLPEQVEDIEQDLKRRLDYMIGGPERIIAVFESLDPDAQKRMLDGLQDSRPDIADELRQRLLAFEDLERLEGASLKVVLREVEMPMLVSAMKGIPESFKKMILENMTEGKREIIAQELELTDGAPVRANVDAQRKIAAIAKRLEKEGQIQIPRLQASLPSIRYSPSTEDAGADKEALTRFESTLDDARNDADVTDIKEKIRRFMNRRVEDAERYPQDSNGANGADDGKDA